MTETPPNITGPLFSAETTATARKMVGLPPLPVPTATQQIATMLEHLKAARRIAYDLGVHTTVDMISKLVVSIEMAMSVVEALP